MRSVVRPTLGEVRGHSFVIDNLTVINVTSQVSTESEAKTVIDWRKNELMRKKQEEDDAVISERRKEHHDAYHARLLGTTNNNFRCFFTKE